MRKFKLIYKLNEVTETKDLSKSEFDTFRLHIKSLIELRDILFRTLNFRYAEQYFNKNKDLTGLHSETELYHFILSTVAIIRMNIDSWSFYIKKNYQNNKLFFPTSTEKSIFDEKCSYYYDKFIFYGEKLPFIVEKAGETIEHIKTYKYDKLSDINQIVLKDQMALFEVDEDKGRE